MVYFIDMYWVMWFSNPFSLAIGLPWQTGSYIDFPGTV
jgi:hypothetical protein